MTLRTAKAISLAALGLTALLSGCGLHGKPKVERKDRATVDSRLPANPFLEARAPTEPNTVVAPGIVEPWGGQVDLSAKEPGWIARIAVKEGDAVQAGQFLATLDDAAQRSVVDVARAEVAEAEAALARVKNGPTAEELRQAQADHDAAVARGTLARSAAARTTRLHREGAVTNADADQVAAEAQVETAMEARAAARLDELKRGARAEDRAAAIARVNAARARLELAEASLARRRITAPEAGTVLLSRFHTGEFYDPSTGPLFVIGDTSKLRVRLEVDEIDAFRVNEGMACALYGDDDAKVSAGTVFRLAPRMGRRGLRIESPTAREDVRVREVFVEVQGLPTLVPGRRLWGHVTGGLADDSLASRQRVSLQNIRPAQ